VANDRWCTVTVKVNILAPCERVRFFIQKMLFNIYFFDFFLNSVLF
jgi:hypothetical protein